MLPVYSYRSDRCKEIIVDFFVKLRMVIQWCLILKIVLQNFGMFMTVYTKVVCWKAQWLKVWPEEFHKLGLALFWCHHLPAVCRGASYRACWASVSSFVIRHNEVCGRHTWLSMKNPFSSCFLANTATNLFRFGANLYIKKSGPLLNSEEANKYWCF